MVAAPTTDSETAPSMSPTRSRTRAYAADSRCWKCAARRNSGRKQTQTTSGQLPGSRRHQDGRDEQLPDADTTSMQAAQLHELSRSCRRRWSPARPATPRRSVFWVSTDRSWTCRNALIRSVASPPSAARNRRHVDAYADTAVSSDADGGDGDQRGHDAGVGTAGGEDALVDGLLDGDGHETRPTVDEQRSAACRRAAVSSGRERDAAAQRRPGRAGLAVDAVVAPGSGPVVDRCAPVDASSSARPAPRRARVGSAPLLGVAG